jgi:archaellum component FlaG (FlaF/FlaG flagellin family)
LFTLLIVVAAVVVYFVAQELQQETRSFSISVEIRGSSKEEVFSFVSDPTSITSIHPLA